MAYLRPVYAQGVNKVKRKLGLKNPALAFLDVALLWLALLATIVAFGKARLLAAVLLAPSPAWVTFASALDSALRRLNR